MLCRHLHMSHLFPSHNEVGPLEISNLIRPVLSAILTFNMRLLAALTLFPLDSIIALSSCSS